MRASKKVLAVLIAALIALTPLLTAFAQETEKGYEQDCPYVYVHGFMGSTVYVDASNPDSEAAWPPSTDKILTAVKGCLPALGRLVIDHNYEKFADAAMPLAYECLSDIMLDPSGNIGNKSGIIWEYPESGTINAQSKVSFRYDWRLDPIEIATQLSEFIDYVLEESGCDQVVLEGHSFGGVVLMTYSKLFGNSKVRSYIFNTTAVYGETYNGELMTGNMILDPDGLMAFLDATFDYNEKEKLIDGIFKLLDSVGLVNAVCKLGNRILDKLLMRASADVVVPMFGGWLSIWSMIPDDKIDAAEDFVFNTVYKNDPTDRSGLIEKIDNYNEKIRADKTETLKKINEESNMYVISRYGYASMFISDSWRLASDTVIDVKNNSFGATAADFQTVLPDDYIASKDPKYISPDKTIDASTCLFPEQTWFVRHLTHAVNVDDLDEMYMYLAYHDGQATVDTFEQYPRFLCYNEDEDTIEPDNFVPEEKVGFFRKIINMIKSFFEYIVSIFKK